MKALIDGDIVAYRCAAVCEGKPFEEAQQAADNLIGAITERVGADTYSAFFTPENKVHFRYDLYPDYKGKRPSEKPTHLEALRAWMYQDLNLFYANYCEADDMLRIWQDIGEDTISCTIDKDDLTYPGWKYNFVNGDHKYLDEKDAWFNFYCQMLIGDTVDNIQGVAGIGKKKAPRILQGLTVPEMHEAVSELYDNSSRFILNYNLFQMWPAQWTLYDGVKNNFYNTREEFDFALQQLKEELKDWKNEAPIDQPQESDLN